VNKETKPDFKKIPLTKESFSFGRRLPRDQRAPQGTGVLRK